MILDDPQRFLAVSLGINAQWETQVLPPAELAFQAEQQANEAEEQTQKARAAANAASTALSDLERLHRTARQNTRNAKREAQEAQRRVAEVKSAAFGHWRQFGLPGIYSHAWALDLEPTNPENAEACAQVARFPYGPAGALCPAHWCMVVAGPTGCGKTTLAARWLALQDPFEQDTEFVGWAALVRKFHTASKAEYDQLLRRYGTSEPVEGGPAEGCRVLLIDDALSRVAGAGTPEFCAGMVGEIIRLRHENNLLTILTTNADADELKEKLGDAVFSRICEGLEWVEMTGEDLRPGRSVPKPHRGDPVDSDEVHHVRTKHRQAVALAEQSAAEEAAIFEQVRAARTAHRAACTAEAKAEASWQRLDAHAVAARDASVRVKIVVA